MTDKEPVEITRAGIPRWVTVLLAFIVLANIASWLWLQFLPRPGDVTPHVLSVDADGDANVLAMQVETGRTYQRIYERQNIAVMVVREWLIYSAIALLIIFAIVDAERLRFNRKKPDKVADR